MRRDTFPAIKKRSHRDMHNYEGSTCRSRSLQLKRPPFILSTSTHIGYPEGNEKLRQTAVFLSGYIREMTGIETEVTADTGSSNSIRLVLDRTAVSSPELPAKSRQERHYHHGEFGSRYILWYTDTSKITPVTGQKEISFSGRTDSRRAGIPLPGNASRRRPPFLLD